MGKDDLDLNGTKNICKHRNKHKMTWSVFTDLQLLNSDVLLVSNNGILCLCSECQYGINSENMCFTKKTLCLSICRGKYV